MFHTLFLKYRSQITVGLYIVLAALVLLLFIYAGFLSGLNINNYKMARLQVEIGQDKRVFEGEVVEGMTVLEAINASALAGNITFKYVIDGVDNKLSIVALDGYSSDNKDLGLNIYVNDSKIDTEQIHMILIEPSDTIVIKSE